MYASHEAADFSTLPGVAAPPTIRWGRAASQTPLYLGAIRPSNAWPVRVAAGRGQAATRANLGIL